MDGEIQKALSRNLEDIVLCLNVRREIEDCEKGVEISSRRYCSFTCFAASDGRVVVGVRRRMVSIEEDAGYCIQTSTCITPRLYLSSNLLFTSEPLSRMTMTMDSWLCKREAVKR